MNTNTHQEVLGLWMIKLQIRHLFRQMDGDDDNSDFNVKDEREFQMLQQYFKKEKEKKRKESCV